MFGNLSIDISLIRKVVRLPLEKYHTIKCFYHVMFSNNFAVDFDDAVPTKTHMAILGLQQRGIVKYVVSQNIDGLHLRSGYPRYGSSNLHNV